jgi:hypothetical protein
MMMAATLLVASSLPALSECRGRITPNAHWDADYEKWSTAELVRAQRDYEAFKVADPGMTASPAAIASIIDQHECKLGVTHDEAFAIEFSATHQFDAAIEANRRIPLSELVSDEARKRLEIASRWEQAHPPNFAESNARTTIEAIEAGNVLIKQALIKDAALRRAR